MRYNLFIILFIIGCSNILYNHNDTMSMLVSKQMVIDKFGEPSELIKREVMMNTIMILEFLKNVLIILIHKFQQFLDNQILYILQQMLRLHLNLGYS